MTAQLLVLAQSSPQWTRAVNGTLFVVLLGCTLALMAGTALVATSGVNVKAGEMGRQFITAAIVTAFIAAGTGPLVNWAVNQLYGLNNIPAEVRDSVPSGGRPRAADPSTCSQAQVLRGHC